MASLREQLSRILPNVLPTNPEAAINGTELLGIVRQKLDSEYSQYSIRQHFSAMSADPTSPIAKVDQGHGYYRRYLAVSPAIPTASAEQFPAVGFEPDPGADEEQGGRMIQQEEKFRSIFIRYAEFNNQFPVNIEHTRCTKQKAGINKWKFPDVVALRWEVGEVSDAGFKLATDLLEVKRSLGEQPFKLISAELKVVLNAGFFRQAFFQCVSNSKWAHSAQLVVAAKVTDETVAEELRRLGASYDVSVISYGLDPEYLDTLQPADKLMKLSDEDFEVIASKISMNRIAVGKDRETLDWEHVRDLRLQSEEFSDVFRWTAYCLEKKLPYSYADWRHIANLEGKYA